MKRKRQKAIDTDLIIVYRNSNTLINKCMHWEDIFFYLEAQACMKQQIELVKLVLLIKFYTSKKDETSNSNFILPNI
jgi:hypothetical protein